MDREWKITKVAGGANRSQLMGCNVYRTTAGNMQFRYPASGTGTTPTVHATIVKPSTGDIVPTFDFAKINSELNGSVKRDWYIRVVAMDVGPDKNLIYGEWSNDPFSIVVDPSDTFTAQAGV